MLAVPDAVASNWLSEPALTAELVFDEVLEDGQDGADYHNTMNGAKIIAWLRKHLFPTFEHLYPGKKMYLVLDNASYHAPRDETWISASKQKHKEGRTRAPAVGPGGDAAHYRGCVAACCSLPPVHGKAQRGRPQQG